MEENINTSIPSFGDSIISIAKSKSDEEYDTWIDELAKDLEECFIEF